MNPILKCLRGLLDLTAVLLTCVMMFAHIGQLSQELAPLFANNWNLWFSRVAAGCGLLLLSLWAFVSLPVTPSVSRNLWPVYVFFGFAGQLATACAAALMARHGVAAWWQAVVPMLCFALGLVIGVVLTSFGFASILHLTLDAAHAAVVAPFRWGRRVAGLVAADEKARTRS